MFPVPRGQQRPKWSLTAAGGDAGAMRGAMRGRHSPAERRVPSAKPACVDGHLQLGCPRGRSPPPVASLGGVRLEEGRRGNPLAGGRTRGFARSGLPRRETGPSGRTSRAGAAPGRTDVNSRGGGCHRAVPALPQGTCSAGLSLEQTKRAKSGFSSIKSPVKPRRDSSRPRF